MSCIAFIFARGGSKGLPGKNVMPFAGKPLIAWAIEHASEVGRIDQVIVSTDSDEIATVAKEYGATVPFLRPEKLAQDESPEWLSWQHALEFVQSRDGCLPEVFVSVPVTAPLRKSSDIEKCLDLFEGGNVDVVITTTDSRRSPYFNMVKKNDDGSVGLVLCNENGVSRRQDAPLVYDMTTVSYVARPEFVMNSDGLFEGRVKSVHIPLERSVDIDTALDFQIAEYLFTKVSEI